MSYTDFRELNNSNPGTTSPPRFGSDTIDEITKIFNNKTVPNRRPNVSNPWMYSGPLTFKQLLSLPTAPADDTMIDLFVHPTTKRIVIQKQSGIVEIENLISLLSQLSDIAISSPANNDQLRYSTALGKWQNVAGSVTGEANTASNVGTSGVGIYKQKSGVNLELKKLTPGSSNVTITDDVANSTVVIDASAAGEANTYSNAGVGGIGITLTKSGVNLPFKSVKANSTKIAVTDGAGNNNVLIDAVEANFSHNNIGGTLAVSKGGTGKTTATLNALLKGQGGTTALAEIGPGSEGQVLTIVSGAPAYATPAAGSTALNLPDGTTTTKPRWGMFYGGGFDGWGLLGGLTLNGVSFGSAPGATENFSTFTANTSDGAAGGVQTKGAITRYDYNPTFVCRFKNLQSTERMFIGLLDEPSLANVVNTDNQLDSHNGVGLMFSDVIGSYTALWNNGTASQQSTTSSTAKDTLAHTVKFVLNNTAGTVTIDLDGAHVVNASTTAVPTASAGLYMYAHQESIGSTGPQFQTAYMYIIADH